MLSQYKKIIAIFGIVTFLVSCLFTVSFAYDREEMASLFGQVGGWNKV